MRMRKKKNTDVRIQNCSTLFLDKKPFSSQKPIELEIGCGKGSFICQLAARNPDIEYVAMEKVSDVAMLAAENAARAELTNVHFIIGDAKELPACFEKSSVQRIYLNFSDPWTRSGYKKRRLTYRAFLEIYKELLTADGSLFFKTDDRELFDFSLEEFEFAGLETRVVTYDLHNSEYMKDNIMTEYEKHFSSLGMPIHHARTYMKPDSHIIADTAKPEHIDDIMPLFAQGRAYMKEHGIPQWQDGYPTRELIEADIENKCGHVLLFKNRPVGYAMLTFDGESCYDTLADTTPYAAIGRVIISSQYKGMGLAGKLMKYFIDLAKQNGFTRLNGNTSAENRSMRRMFEKNGFEPCGKITLENGEPRIAYTLRIV